MAACELAPMSLALLGGEGLRPESTPLWRALLAHVSGSEQRVLVLQAVSDDHPRGTRERRATLIAESLQQLGLSVELLSLAEPLASVETISRAPVLYLTGDALSLSARLYSAALWESIRSGALRPGLLIASGSAAVSLGGHAFVPVKPYPAALESLQFEMLPGLGLLPGVIVLPYFAWLPDSVIDKIMALAPPASTLVGIDDQAALIATDHTWEVGGLGSVTITRLGSPPRIVDAGTAVPPDLLFPHRLG